VYGLVIRLRSKAVVLGTCRQGAAPVRNVARNENDMLAIFRQCAHATADAVARSKQQHEGQRKEQRKWSRKRERERENKKNKARDGQHTAAGHKGQGIAQVVQGG